MLVDMVAVCGPYLRFGAPCSAPASHMLLVRHSPPWPNAEPRYLATHVAVALGETQEEYYIIFQIHLRVFAPKKPQNFDGDEKPIVGDAECGGLICIRESGKVTFRESTFEVQEERMSVSMQADLTSKPSTRFTLVLLTEHRTTGPKAHREEGRERGPVRGGRVSRNSGSTLSVMVRQVEENDVPA